MDTLSSQARSALMSRVRSRGNRSTELKLIQWFRRSRIRGWRRRQKVYGHPDFVFWPRKIAVFVDGDFWHGHPTRGRIPKTNRAFWARKVAANRKRDRWVNRVLRSKGWMVIRIWESELNKSKMVAKLRPVQAGEWRDRACVRRSQKTSCTALDRNLGRNL